MQVVRFATSVENKADKMTRVVQRWLNYREAESDSERPAVSAALSTGESHEDAIWAAHLSHHLGIDRTFYLVKQIRSDLTRDQVKRGLARCEACQGIDPAARTENLVGRGNLAVEDDWCRVAAAFRSAVVQQFADRWGIRLRFRAAYAPNGQGIVEWNHRTIQRIAARGEISPEEATYWCGSSPHLCRARSNGFQA